MKAKFSLSLENAKHIPIDKYAHDFTFIVNGKPYETSRFLADLLSPTISDLHSVDKTANTFTITTTRNNQEKEQNSNNKIDYFSDFLNLTMLEEHEIDETRQDYYSEYFIQLGNFDEYIKLQQKYYDEITTENVLDRINRIQSIYNKTKSKSTVYENFITKLVTFASNHFHELDEDNLL